MMVPGPTWRCFLVLAMGAVGSLAQGLDADWASMQPLYQEGLSANWPSVVVSAPTSSGGVRNVDPWAYGNLCVLVTAESINRTYWNRCSHQAHGILCLGSNDVVKDP